MLLEDLHFPPNAVTPPNPRQRAQSQMHDRKLTQSIDLFDSQERERLAADEQLSIYRDLTTDHVMGLLDAWANYLVRRIGSEPEQVGWQSLPAPPQVGAAHRNLVELGRRVYLEGQG